ncbi:MAG TPA: exonuclease SbcCD subunit D C-terminal domain-containing protein [bacterium]|nr:exonuclease SbcCD subunit D C-terminal domain-containing protein [bacterium]HPS29363.1 exonuclease SbcCD subunit D C-terminal domain-containing protein [bacterium]
MKILHTSDWHLGRSLYGRKRHDEFSAFLEWLYGIIAENCVDVLLIAGDVFDSVTPGNSAQKLYYNFLSKISGSCCRHAVIIGGNHDSPSFLNAPKELLRAFNVYVIGDTPENAEDEVLVLENDEKPEAIVCAVPYLRDRDLRTVEPGETIDDKNAKLVDGLKKHYENVCTIAENKRSELEKKRFSHIPVIVTGHLFTSGGKTVDGDGVHELYVGSLVHVGAEIFLSSIDYVALGHLHIPQTVGEEEHIRYSGSPLPMGFGEATQDKKVVLVEFNDGVRNIQEITIPCFQKLVRIEGSLDDISNKINELKLANSSAWLGIEYTGQEVVGNLREQFDELLSGSKMEIRRIKNRQSIERVINSIHENEVLDDLDTNDIFHRCLDAFDVPEEERKELTVSYNDIIRSLQEEDTNAE